jgi:hypothetical protein
MLNMKRSVIALSALAVAALASPVMTSSSAHAYACKGSPTQTVAVQKYQTTAYHEAIAKWKSKTRSDHGLAWSVWEIAKHKTVNCVAAGGGNTACVAVGKACKYVTP